ncbi:class F sortase [Streptomyces sp. NPDC059851]|uniref:class F sortase n=1 Tax=Streptomyces sp. NPDC059851 TaxID=3346971 RepID=UPI00365986E6
MTEDESELPRRRWSPWGVLALVMLSGLAMIRNGADVGDGPPQPTAAAAVSASEAPAPGVSAPADPAAPVQELDHSSVQRIRIPAIRVDAPVMTVGLDAQGWVDAPPAEESNLAGWYLNGISPGQRGSSVIVGHVDNATGPAVFYGLGSLRKGHRIEVERYDGRTAVFEVYGVEVFSKDTFPGSRVYGDTGRPELRVITCGGGYSKAKGYDGNVVVFARMVEAR